MSTCCCAKAGDAVITRHATTVLTIVMESFPLEVYRRGMETDITLSRSWCPSWSPHSWWACSYGEGSKSSTTQISDREEYTAQMNLRPSGVMVTPPISSKGRTATVVAGPPSTDTRRILASVFVSPPGAVGPRKFSVFELST